MIEYKFLTGVKEQTIHEANLDAFSDYVIPLQPTLEQFRNHLVQNAIDLDYSVGAFFDGKLVGYSQNGFGMWNGKKTVYDGGTGVVPGFRKKGIATGIFNFMVPKLKEMGYEQMLLEVISTNKNAVSLYEKLGFKKTRDLLFFEQTKKIESEISSDIEISELRKKDLNNIEIIAEGKTSWQFKTDSLLRRKSAIKFFSARVKNEIVGYCCIFEKSGSVPQLGVKSSFRGKGIGSALLKSAQERILDGEKLRFGNVDSELTSLIGFLKSHEFEPSISQKEMILKF